MKRIPLIWSLAIVLAAIDAAGLLATGLTLNPALAWRYPVIVLLLVSFALLCKRHQADPRIASVLYIEGVSVAYFALTLILSYVAVGLRRPLVDPALVRFDRALGFDWPVLYQWIAGHPLLHAVLFVVYLSFFLQIVLVQLVLNWRGQIARSWEYLWLFIVSCLISIVFAGIWPAIGAFAVFKVELGTPYLHDIAALHSGTLGMIGRTPVQGVVEFPSFHTAMAILSTYASRGVPVFFPVMVAVNVLMVVSTLPIGGHHLADVLAGIAVALAAIAIVRSMRMPETAP